MSTSSSDRLNQTINLTDGRRLAYAEYGDPGGVPLFLFHGLPGSRLSVQAFWDDEPNEFRVISPDRPGMGLSDFQPGRRLLDWPSDVRQLADALGIDRFLVAGVSGGAAHAVVCAYAMPERVIAAASICGGAPMDQPGVIESMHRPNRIAFKLARRAPFLLWPMFAPLARLAKRNPAKALEMGKKSMPKPDLEAIQDPQFRRVYLETAGESYRQGVRGVIHEARIHAAPWGFDLADIKCKVFLFHGDEDANAPVAMVEQLAAKIPDHKLVIYPDEGHLIIVRHWQEMKNALLSSYRSPRSIG